MAAYVLHPTDPWMVLCNLAFVLIYNCKGQLYYEKKAQDIVYACSILGLLERKS